MAFELPQLPYAKDALEPHIDTKTMEIHHGKHHAEYTNNLNNAIKGTELDGQSIEVILSKVGSQSIGIRNNGGGFYNHSLFWSIMSPNGGGAPSGELAQAIDNAFGSFESFKDHFSKAAASRFGSGWAWLVVVDGKLEVSSTANQDNPLMDVSDVKGTPILGLDVWEHAYYLNYMSDRKKYINNFWKIVNWDKVSEKYEELN